MQTPIFFVFTVFTLLILCAPDTGSTLTLSDYGETLPESQNSFQSDSGNLLLAPMIDAQGYQETEDPDFMRHRPGVTPLQEDTVPRNPEYIERVARAKAEAAMATQAAETAPPAQAEPSAPPVYTGPPLTLEPLPEDIANPSLATRYPPTQSPPYSSPSEDTALDTALQQLALPHESERLLAHPAADNTPHALAPYAQHPPQAPAPPQALPQYEAPGFHTRPDAPVIPSPDHPSNQSRLYRNSVEAASPLRSPSEAILSSDLYSIEDTSHRNSPAWELLALINTHRMSGIRCGTLYHDPVPGLESTPLLAQITNKQAADMDTRSYLSSTTPEGKSVGARLTEAGHPWGTVMEIFKRGPVTAQGALDSWMNDPKSCARIMDNRYTHAGFGYSSRSNVWVLTLAGPKSTAQ